MAKEKFNDIHGYLLDPSKKALKEKHFFDLFVSKGLEFFSGGLRGDKVINYESPENLRKILDEKIPKAPISKKQLIKLLNLIGGYSISQADKRYLAFPDSGNSKYAIGGAIYSQFLNQNQIAFDRSAPIGTIIEIQLIEWLRELIGYKTIPLEKINMLSKVGGMWTPGGSLSNYISILTALNSKFPLIEKHGIASIGVDKKPVILMTKGIEHYSYKSACSWLGLGSDAIVWVEPGENYTSSAKNLKNAIKGIEGNKVPFYVVAVAGNCRTSGLDDLEKMYEVCKKYKLWFHVDACHGGSFLFSKKYKHLIKGIEKADSVSLDPHKSLFIPYSSSYILFKNSSRLSIFSRYPDKVNTKEYLDMGLITPFLGSRGFESLKFWLTIKGAGMNVLGKLIERRQKLASYWHALLTKNENIVILNDLDFYRISFVVFPKKRLKEVRAISGEKVIGELISKYTHIVSDELYKTGMVCMDEFKLNDLNKRITNDEKIIYTAIGTTIGNASIDKKNLIQSNKLLASSIKNLIGQYNKEIDDLICGNIIKKTKIFPGDASSPAHWS